MQILRCTSGVRTLFLSAKEICCGAEESGELARLSLFSMLPFHNWKWISPDSPRGLVQAGAEPPEIFEPVSGEGPSTAVYEINSIASCG